MHKCCRFLPDNFFLNIMASQKEQCMVVIIILILKIPFFQGYLEYDDDYNDSVLADETTTVVSYIEFSCVCVYILQMTDNYR